MEELYFTIEAEDAGMRMDKFIANKLGEDYSRTFVKFLIDNEFVTVDEETVKPRHSTKEGERVVVVIPPPEVQNLDPEDIPIKILYEDEHIIVVDKPVGMVVHPGAGNKKGTLVSAILFHCGELPEGGNVLRPGMVHRLDKDTSGVIIIAKNDRALRSLAKQFQNRTVKKQYVAIVKGRVESDNAIIDEPVSRHASDRRKMDIEPDKGKNARTIYHVVERLKRFTVLKIDLETGRTHQIRVHMQHIGHPVVGDRTYGGGHEMERQALHAEKLGITHPGTGKHMEFIAPLPDDMIEFITKEKAKEL